MKTHKNIDSYIDSAPETTKALLRQIRTAIREVAPEAEETISYGIPTYKLHGNLVHFGGFQDHVSFFPTSSGVDAFRKDLSKYKIARGTIRFPLDKPLPIGLIKRIVAFRVKEVQEKKTPRPSRARQAPARKRP